MLGDMLHWTKRYAPAVLPQLPFGQAFVYTLSTLEVLAVFLDKKVLLADNNICKRVMRPPYATRSRMLAGSGNCRTWH
jgi:hypothetical protein